MICLATVLLFDYEIPDGDGGWGTPDALAQWEYGVATSGPMTGPVWGTRLAGDYFNDANATLEILLPDTTAADRPVLVLEHWYSFGAGDRGVLELEDGNGTVSVTPLGGFPGGGQGYTGSSGRWETLGIDLGGVGPNARIRLRLEADDAGRAAGWYVRAGRIDDGDPIPPDVTITASPVDTQDLDGPYAIEAEIIEDFFITTADVGWTGAGSGTTAMQWVSETTWRGTIPAQPPGTDVSWQLQVADCNTSTVVPGDPFRVFLAAPENLQGPAQPHVVGRNVTLTWSPPVSPHVPDAYEVECVSSGDVFGPVTDLQTDVPLEPGEPQDFVVRAIYPQGTGDSSDVLSLDVEVPELTSVTPSSVFPGDRVYVEIEGRSLYLLDGVSSMVLGEMGVTVESFEVRDVNRGIALVDVDAEATPGARTVLLTGAQGAFGFDEAFEVLDAADAPRILSVEPDSVVQGEEVTLVVQASQPFAGPITVTTDDEIISGGTPEFDGDTVTLRVAASGRARPGNHDIILDDGERLWSVPLEVDEFIIPPRRQCSAVDSPVWWLGLVALFARRSRRR